MCIRDSGKGDDKKQQFKDIKTMEKDMKNQLKDLRKDNKNPVSYTHLTFGCMVSIF